MASQVCSAWTDQETGHLRCVVLGQGISGVLCLDRASQVCCAWTWQVCRTMHRRYVVLGQIKKQGISVLRQLNKHVRCVVFFYQVSCQVHVIAWYIYAFLKKQGIVVV